MDKMENKISEIEDVRTLLNLEKHRLGIKSDEELAYTIGFNKDALNKWVQRNKIPDKWKSIITQTESIKSSDKKTNNTIEKKIILDINLIIDNAIYSAKRELNNILKGRIGVKTILQEILMHIDSNDNEYTPENSKQRLVDQIKGSEINLLKLKTTQKTELLSNLIDENISKIEAYAMIKYPKEIFN